MERQSEERAARRARPGVDRSHRPLRRERLDVAKHRGVLRFPVDLGHRKPFRRQDRYGRPASGDSRGTSRGPFRVKKHLCGVGILPEGIAANPVVYDWALKTAWEPRSARSRRLPAPIHRLPLRHMERPCLRSLAAVAGVCLRRVRNQGGRDLRIHLLRPPRTGCHQRFDVGSQTVPV